MSYPDIPVVCTKSGLVMLLELVVDASTLEFCVQEVHIKGQQAVIQGFPCPACRIKFGIEVRPTGVELNTIGVPVVLPSVKPSCDYRPLRDPLFIPR